MNIVVVKDKEALSRWLTRDLEQRISTQPRLVLGLATGSTFSGFYKKLVRFFEKERLSFRDVTTFNLDEYVDIDDGHPQTYRCVMDTNLFDHIDIDKKRTFFPPVSGEEKPEVYDELIKRAGGIDLQYLGIGVNGHIAFNEPGTPFSSKTHKIQLAKATREANKRFFDSKKQVPQFAVTMGLATIMNAKEIVLAASGKKKASVIEKMVYGPIEPSLPASVLRRHHHVTVVLDREAAQNLKEGDYVTA